MLDCIACNLCLNRKNIVIGVGSPKAEIVLIGEAPGATEDKQGIPFVGRAGKVLNNILLETGFKKEDLYITNVVKCRPPYNAVPNESDVKTCTEKFLYPELAYLTTAKIYILLGDTATRTILKVPLYKVKHSFNFIFNRLYVSTYHPSAVLYDKSTDASIYNSLVKDFTQVMSVYRSHINPFYNLK